MNGRHNKPRKLRGGPIAQSGQDLRPRGEQGAMTPLHGPYRAVVIASRVLGEDGHLRGASVECDVLLIKTQVPLKAVPVAQRQHGVNNVHDLWVPRPTTRIVGDDDTPLNVNRVLSRRGAYLGPATPLGDIDGDQVLVDFIEGNRDYPIIVASLPHERTNRQLAEGAGWREGSTEERGSPRRDEQYTHHYGCEIRVNEQGDLLIDTVGAYSDITTEDSSGLSGQIRLRVKESQRFTVAMGDDEDVLEVFKAGGQLRIDLGAGADQRIPLGDDQVTALKALTDALDAFAAALATATPAAPNAALTVADVLLAYSGGPPGSALAPKLVQVKIDLDAALSDLAKTKKT